MLCCRSSCSVGVVETRAGSNFASIAKNIQTTRRRRRPKKKKSKSKKGRQPDISGCKVTSPTCGVGGQAQPCATADVCLSPSMDDMPDELLLEIVGFIPPLSETFAHLRRTSRRFHSLMQTECLYQTIAIDISNGRPFDFDTFNLTVFRSAATLTEVNLAHCSDVTDYVVYQFAMKCRQIAAVDLSHCARLTNVGLRVLANLVMLKRVDISGCPKVTGRGLHLLVKLNGDSLEQVAVNGCLGFRNDPSNMLHISKYCCKMKRLEMAWDPRLIRLNPLAGVNMDRLTKNLDGLEFLDISGSLCTDDGLCAIVMNCSHLETLKLQHCLIHDVGLKHISEWLPNLTHLDVSDCHDITDAGLEHLGHGCRLLRHLDVSRCFGVAGDGLFTLVCHCTQLRTLVARECFDLTEDAIAFISVICDQVRHFDVAFNFAVTDETMSTIRADRKAGEELVVVTEGCPNTSRRDDVGGENTTLLRRDRHRFRFVEWKGVDTDTFVIWETAV